MLATLLLLAQLVNPLQGYTPIEEVNCVFPEGILPCVRLEKEDDDNYFAIFTPDKELFAIIYMGEEVEIIWLK